MSQAIDKRKVDFELITEWVQPGSCVLDLGCGRGILLQHLQQKKGAYSVGVDSDLGKILSCVKRGVAAYHGDMEQLLSIFPERYFDWVIMSRTLQELSNPMDILRAALRVGRHIAVGFANYDYWVARRTPVAEGVCEENLLFDRPWHEAKPSLPVSTRDFETVCEREGIIIGRREFITGEGVAGCSREEAGYALYELLRD